MRRIVDAMEDATGALLAWAIAASAVHTIWKAGYHEGLRTAEADGTPPPLSLAKDPEAES